jgi:hypothetical protein
VGSPSTIGPSTFYALSPNAVGGVWFRQKLAKSEKFLALSAMVRPGGPSGQGAGTKRSTGVYVKRHSRGEQECLVNREAVATYRLYAANCIELAEHVGDVDRRVFLLSMARDWLKLAEQAERAAFDAKSLPERPDGESAID